MNSIDDMEKDYIELNENPLLGLEKLIRNKENNMEKNRIITMSIERYVGKYLLQRLGLNAYEVSPARLRVFFENLKIDKHELMNTRIRKPHYQLRDMKKLQSKSGPEGYKALKRKIEIENAEWLIQKNNSNKPLIKSNKINEKQKIKQSIVHPVVNSNTWK